MLHTLSQKQPEKKAIPLLISEMYCNISQYYRNVMCTHILTTRMGNVYPEFQAEGFSYHLLPGFFLTRVYQPEPDVSYLQPHSILFYIISNSIYCFSLGYNPTY